jgi:small nuclear ribonucleoprotein (snRNP)-like protein
LASLAFRRFGEEMLAVIGKRVLIVTSDGKEYQGDLIGIDEKLDLILNKVSGAGAHVFKVILNGEFIKEIRLLEKPFDLHSLADRLSKVFPGLVKLREDIGAIIVMEKIKVTEQGVEGSGLAFEKVRVLYDQFVKETVKQTQT